MRFRHGVLTLAALALLGCQQQAQPTPAATDNACAQLGDKLCEAAGTETATCLSLRTALPLLSAQACTVGLSDVEGSIARLKEQRAPCTELVTKLCKDLGEQSETCAMVKDRTQGFLVQQCSAMLAQYGDVLADLRRQEAANQPLDASKQAQIATGDAPSFGPKDATVTIVEFSDFQCPYCTEAAKVVSELKDKYGTKVRFVFRQFPLSMHPDAHLAAQASLAAHAQGKFWPFHDLLFKNQNDLSRAALERHAQAAGLDLAKFKAALDQGTYKAQVEADLALGETVGVQGTPTMFINGQRIGNPTDPAGVSAAVERALKAS